MATLGFGIIALFYLWQLLNGGNLKEKLEVTAPKFRAYFLLRISAAIYISTAVSLAGCVPDEEEFIADHPPPGISVTSSSGCITPTGIGTISNPFDLGTAPACHENFTEDREFYVVSIATLGVWYFELRNLSSDVDLNVYNNANFLLPRICESHNNGTDNDTCSINASLVGTGLYYIDADLFDPSVGAFFLLDVYQ